VKGEEVSMGCMEKNRIPRFLRGEDPSFTQHAADCESCREALVIAATLRGYVQSRPQEPHKDHMTPEDQMGWLGGTLDEQESARVLEHLSECSECRDSIAELAADLEVARQVPLAEAPVPWWKQVTAWFRKGPLYVAAPATVATVVALFFVVTLVVPLFESPEETVLNALNGFTPGTGDMELREDWENGPPFQIRQRVPRPGFILGAIPLPPFRSDTDGAEKAENEAYHAAAARVAAGFLLQHLLDMVQGQDFAPDDLRRVGKEIDRAGAMLKRGGIEGADRMHSLYLSILDKKATLENVRTELYKAIEKTTAIPEVKIGRWLYLLRIAALEGGTKYDKRAKEINAVRGYIMTSHAGQEHKAFAEWLCASLAEIGKATDPESAGADIDTLVQKLADGLLLSSSSEKTTSPEVRDLLSEGGFFNPLDDILMKVEDLKSKPGDSE